MAAAFGLPYVFANHFSGEGLERALDIYRSQFRASEAVPEPHTFLTANAIAAATAAEAEERALPQLHQIARLRMNKPPVPLETVEQAQNSAAEFESLAGSVIAAARATWFLGTGNTVATELRAFAARWDVDEVMVVPVAGAYDDEHDAASPGREQTLTLLAAELSDETAQGQD